MRRKEKQVPEEEAYSILERAGFMTLSTVLDDGHPYAVPLNHILLGKSVYFHCAMEGQKNDSFKKENRVFLSAVESFEILPDKFSTNYRSASAFGKIFPVWEGEEKYMALRGIIKKFSPEFIESGNVYIDKMAEKTMIYRIDIEHITGKVSCRKP